MSVSRLAAAVALVSVFALTSSAEARVRHKTYAQPTEVATNYVQEESPISFILGESGKSVVPSKRVIRDKITSEFRVVRTYGGSSRGTGMLSGVYRPLAAKAREIADTCGSSVISGVRHTRVRGTGRMSLHASGHAVDIRGNPGCIYSHLQGWSGGYSTDYRAVNHVHVSLGGREDGLRFAHYHGGHHNHYASRHHHYRVAAR